VKIASAYLKSYKSADTDKIPAVLINAGVKYYILRYTEIFFSILNMEEFPLQ